MQLANTLRRDSAIIVLGIFTWGVACYYLVKNNYQAILHNYKMPAGEAPTSLYHIIWITVYISTLLSIQLVWHNKLDTNEKKKFSTMIVASALLNVMMYVVYYVFHAFLYDNILVGLNIIIVIAIAKFLWPKSRTASLLMLPYFLALVFSLITLNLFILAN